MVRPIGAISWCFFGVYALAVIYHTATVSSTYLEEEEESEFQSSKSDNQSKREAELQMTGSGKPVPAE